MTGTHYEAELSKLGATYDQALRADIRDIKSAIAGASEASIIGVGSGGSYTTASLLCHLHETYTGRVSRPSTPLEIICNPTLAAASPVFLISAEGKNPDIVEALQRARMHSARPIHVITNRDDSPLIDCAQNLANINHHVFELSDKDGYLATNSLLLNCVLIARAYGELDNDRAAIPSTLNLLRLHGTTVADWLLQSDLFVSEAVKRGGVIVAFSPLLRPVAADLESKLSESALLYCQLADLRSFAHGRHLWLAERPQDCAILAMIEPSLERLWTEMRALLPPDIPTLTMSFLGAKPQDLLAGLVGQMRLVSLIANSKSKDPGRPNVPAFGRDLHYINVPQLIPAPVDDPRGGETSKYDVLGARWPSLRHRGTMRRALESFRADLEGQTFRALVFDYDGTLSVSRRQDGSPPQAIVNHIRSFVDDGILIAIASGRGTSIQEELQRSIPDTYWERIYVGLYNAGYISSLARMPDKTRPTSEFLSHVTRIVNELKGLGVPIETIRTNHPYQVSVRFHEGANIEGNWFVIADALRQAGLDLSRVVKSEHSVDILSTQANKSHLVAHVIQECKIDPYQILTMGDQGAWPGNDSSLLEHCYSLSVDAPSRRLDRGWKLAPAHKRDVDATLWYLDRIRKLGRANSRSM
jgi:hydroxymethylpyrimidine pyrophosphatase-like HAD family hydrolase